MNIVLLGKHGYRKWLDRASRVTNSTTTMTFTNPSSTLLFEILLCAQTTGDKISVWWGDGTYNDYTLNNIVGADAVVGHTYATAANRTIVLCGADRVRRLVSIQSDGRSSFGGNITTWTSLTYLSVFGSNTLSGSVAALTSLTYLNVGGSNTLSGFDGVAVSATKLAYLKMNNALDVATVNGILAGFWANRDVAKTRAERVIDLNDNVLSAAPTGQGLIDKAALQAYVSPPGATVWTVSTN